ncbi:MAG: DUF3784 domain-containing protein [Oscillospiraceae bacterium]|nr:DUF3784 domain-containing protein [Oscillospiraceae bacterium]
MTALKIISVIAGLAFTLFGFFIFFKKKYSLINGFDEAFKKGLKTEEYARRVGLTEFAVGLAMLTAALFLIIFC